MTLIVTVNGPESIWLLADRRVSYPRGRTDDARKLMVLATPDGIAVLGYAGLGATVLGTEPADWMAAVLRGRNLTLEQALSVIAAAAEKQIPRHLARLAMKGQQAHTIIASAFVNGEPRLYTIDVTPAPYGTFKVESKRQLLRMPAPRKPRPPELSCAGSGSAVLGQDKAWKRNLLHMVKAHNRGRVSADAVADYLAKLNHQVHLALADGTVGPRCIG